MYNKIILIGNLTKDPELRYTPQGTPVCSFRIAVNNKYKKGDGENASETLFINVVSFGKKAENVSKYLSKGKSVLVEGRLHERRWEAEGQQKSIMEVNASEVRFMPKGSGSGSSDAGHEDIPAEETTDLEPF